MKIDYNNNTAILTLKEANKLVVCGYFKNSYGLICGTFYSDSKGRTFYCRFYGAMTNTKPIYPLVYGKCLRSDIKLALEIIQVTNK